MHIRHAVMEDLQQLAEAESLSFPKEEAASEASIRRRLDVFADRFWLMEQDGQIISFVNGMLTEDADLRDEMFDDAGLHNPAAPWQMLFSVVTRPELRRRGYAAQTLRRVISDCFSEGRRGIVLTCKERLLPFYHRLGFVNEGVSASDHGGALWYQMRLCLNGEMLTVSRVLEDDFGCEGLPEGEEKQVTLICVAGDGRRVTLRMEDALALARGIREGQRVLTVQDGTVIPV